MGKYNYYDIYDQAQDMAESIVDRYESFGTSIKIKDKSIEILKDRFKFGVKLKLGTRVDDVKKHERNVRMSLKLSLFQVIEEGLDIYIVAAKEFKLNNNLRHILASPEYAISQQKMAVPHPLGFDATGKSIIADLTKYPHSLTGGTTESGKTVSIKCLLTSIAVGCSPSRVQLLVCDKALELDQFAEIPQLAHPIIQDPKTFLKVLLQVHEIMERRILLKHTKGFAKLTHLIFVADEFLTFISGITDKDVRRLAVETLSEILRRGRHARIHLVLAAHNPTQQKMLIDVSDLPTRIAFRVAKFNNSIAILGEGGAERLLGNGEMLFLSPHQDKPQRIQGAYISRKGIRTMLEQVKAEYNNRTPAQKESDRLYIEKHGFVIDEADLQDTEVCADESRTRFTEIKTTKQDIDNRLFAEIVIWALARKSISCNSIMGEFNIGWSRAKGFYLKLNGWGIVDPIHEKTQKSVLPDSIDDLLHEALNFLQHQGYTMADITEALNSKSDGQM